MDARRLTTTWIICFAAFVLAGCRAPLGAPQDPFATKPKDAAQAAAAAKPKDGVEQASYDAAPGVSIEGA